MIYSFNYNFDESVLRREAREKEGYAPFVDPKTGGITKEWLIKRDVGDYAKEITNHFEEILGVSIKPRFYIQEKGFTLPFHKDRGTLCAINFVLSNSKDPIEFREESHEYAIALINVQEEHQVTALTEDRILFKLSIFDIDFDTARQRIQQYESGRELKR